MKSMQLWNEIPQPCSDSTREYIDLVFYFSQSASTLPAEFENWFGEYVGRETPTEKDSHLTSSQQLSQCFGTSKLIFAEIPPEDDDYPRGPNRMFRSLFDSKGRNYSFPDDYVYAFWMEWDTFPVKRMWIDRLLWHSSWAKGENDWWVKGSIYQGRAFDLMVQSPDSFSWAAHINGNALYRLNDPQFVDFLEVVEDYQSFNHYWKPFDVSVWRVLHDFPYTWHIYQKCAHRFVVSDFIKHFGFTVTHKDVLEAAHNPNTYLIHGHQHSAGKVQHSAKFDLDGKPIKAVSYNEWEALEEQDHSISVLIVANSGLLDFSVLAVRSVQRFLAGATQVVIVVPEEDFDRFREKHVSKVAIVKKKNTWDSFASFRTNIRLNADDFCTGSLILHLNADSVITRKLMRKDLFWRKKPIALHGRLPQSKTGEAVANALKHTTPWLHLYPTSLHRRSRDVETEKENAKQNRIAHGGSTSGVALEFSILQKNLWETDQHAMSWIPLMNSWDGDHTAGNEEGSDVSRFYPIIPPFICEGQLEIFQGNAVAERTLYELLEDMVPAEKEGKGNCEAAIKYQQRWLAQNSAAT